MSEVKIYKTREVEDEDKILEIKYPAFWNVVMLTDYQAAQARIEKLETANKIMREALKEIYKTNINGANIYSGAEGMQFDAKEAINQVKEMLGDNGNNWENERLAAAQIQVVDELQAKLDRARKALVRLQVRIVESREPSKEDIEASRIIINETLAELKREK